MRYFFFLLLFFSTPILASEAEFNKQFCRAMGGEIEVRHAYSGGTIRTDCETKRHVFEGGLDTRSSLDSVQQVVFASIITGKIPVIILYDTDGKIGHYEYRVSRVSQALNIVYMRCPMGKEISALARILPIE